MAKKILLQNIEIISSSFIHKDYYGKKYYAKINLKESITEFEKATNEVLAAYCENNNVTINRSDLLYDHKGGIVSISSYNPITAFEETDGKTLPIFDGTEDYSGRTADIICELGIYEFDGTFGLRKELNFITIHDTNDPVELMLKKLKKQYESARNPNAYKNNLSDILND